MLGTNDSAEHKTDPKEITEAKKQELEAQWQSEMEAEMRPPM